jgi:quercetin dioxygenase-like cupin family protein
MGRNSIEENVMPLTMNEQAATERNKAQCPAEIAAEFAREAQNPNPCIGSVLLSEDERTRIWMIRLKPGERIGVHRHVLDYFWTAVSAGRSRQYLLDGAPVEHTYTPGETRHETYGKGEFKVHDLENIGDMDAVFLTVEFKDSANEPLPLPANLRASLAV